MIIVELTPRLKKIAELIPKGTFLADVGTDHAYLPVYSVLNGIAKGAAAMDINPGPLKRAEQSVNKYNLQSEIQLRLSDGISALKKGEADVIVIAGMGGLLIKSILEAGKEKIGKGTLLILQPMIAVKELRGYLYNSGFCIDDEYLACEGSKYYNILKVRRSDNCSFNEKDIVIGRNLSTNSPECFEKYAEHKIKVYKKIISGLEGAVSADKEQISLNKSDLMIFKKELEKF